MKFCKWVLRVLWIVFLEFGVLNFIGIYAIMSMGFTIFLLFAFEVEAFCTLVLICLGFV